MKYFIKKKEKIHVTIFMIFTNISNIRFGIHHLLARKYSALWKAGNEYNDDVENMARLRCHITPGHVTQCNLLVKTLSEESIVGWMHAFVRKHKACSRRVNATPQLEYVR